MSFMCMPAHATTPPSATAIAAGTSAPAGANRMAASNFSGGRSVEAPGKRAKVS